MSAEISPFPETSRSNARLLLENLQDPKLMWRWLAIQRADRILSAAGQAMWTFMVKRGRDFLPQINLD